MSSIPSNGILRVLAIPELLDMIFRFLDDASNASNARVCKQWSDVALDVLWYEVYDLSRILSMLAPLKISGDGGTLKFTRTLETSDWQVSERYRRRIRSLSFEASLDKHLHRSVFDEIARSRTSLDILPNTHTLHWGAPSDFCVMFMHKNIKCFSINLSPCRDRITSFFQDIAARMRNITHLDLRFDFAISDIEPDVLKLLSSLTNLRRLTVPRFCFTTKIAEVASQNQHLECIDFQYFEQQGVGRLEDVVNFNPSLQEGAYQSLYELSTTVSFHDAATFLAKPFAPINLVEIYLDSSNIELPADVLYLVMMISENCQLLKSLALISYIDGTAPRTEPYNKENCLTIETLRPLFKCPNLISLDVVHHYPLLLQLADVEEIATSWPSVESISLNNEPIYFDHSDLTLTALLPFARHCPRLHTLGLFINATTVDLEPISKDNFAYPPFRALRRLSMGVSILAQEGPVALFLSHICPLGCVIDSGVTWDSASAWYDDMTWATIGTRFDKWVKVMELLPLLTKLRVEERERVRLLKREVEDLRVRTRVLMDKASLLTKVDGCITI